MMFVYLDEFGHPGPFVDRSHQKYNTSPVFGLAGILLPEEAVRGFGSFFLNQKKHLLSHDIEKANVPAYAWEKKGTNLFTERSIERYPEIRRTAFRILNRIKSERGRIFYYGREKFRGADERMNANGLYKTVLAHALRAIDDCCSSIDENFIIVIDQHSARKTLLETAAKTMYGKSPCLRMSSSPFEVESYLNQNIQAADWIATLVGRLWSYRIEPQQFSGYQPYDTYFWSRIHAVSTHSSVLRRPEPKDKMSSPLL